MKILCVTQRFFPALGGAEQAIEKNMDFLSQNHDVTVYTSNAYDLNSFWDENGKTISDFTNKNYNIKRYQILVPYKVPDNLFSFPFTISSPGPFCPEMWNDLINIKEKYDLIIATAFPYDHIIPALIASKKHNIPIIIIPHLHLEFPYLHFTGLKLSILSEATAIVVNTEEEKNALTKRSISGDKIHIISPGIEIKQHSHQQNDIRKKLGISKDSLIVLFVGNKSPEKGVINLMESMKIFWEQNKNIELILIGSSTKEFKFYIKQQSQKIKKRIFDLGTVSEDKKWTIFNSCDIFAMPSKSESFGISYLEAWLFKKPVVACDLKAISNVIDDEKNGLLIKFGDKDELFLAIQKLLDPKLRKLLGENGFEKLSQKFDSEEQCRKFEQLCLSLVKV